MTVALWMDACPVPYPEALERMDARVQAIQKGQAPETVWFLEHPALYTAGPRAKHEHLRNPQGLPVYSTPRGGQYTYHGPGQRMGYLMLDVKKRGQDLRKFVWQIEEWLIRSLETVNLHAERRAERVGLWIPSALHGERKIAALGVRVQKWVSSHGFALNICPDLKHFQGIVPCGLEHYGVTSLIQEGIATPSVEALDEALKNTFPSVFHSSLFLHGATMM